MTRREFLCQSAAWSALCLGAPALAQGAAPLAPNSQRQRPNILIFLLDDAGFSDLGCYGGEILTPHLDELARGGVRFGSFTNAARCCPSRAALLTGLYPHRAGMGYMTTPHGGPGPYQGFLSDNSQTIAQTLGGVGYSTFLSGKWHVGNAREHWPHTRGFDEFYGLIGGASNYFAPVHESELWVRNQTVEMPNGDDFYATDAIAQHALDCIARRGPNAAPFFGYVAFTAPHWPIQAREEDIAPYRAIYAQGWDVLRAQRFERLRATGLINPQMPLSPRHPDVAPWSELSRDEQRNWAEKMAIYAGMLARTDAQIGRIVRLLRERGELENTLILFASDNGASPETTQGRARNRGITPATAPLGARGSFDNVGRPWANLSNTPFRWFKRHVFEGGIATPFIAHWPRGLRVAGTVENTPAHLIDIAPTCLEAAGASHPKFRGQTPLFALEGQSLLPPLRGEKTAPRPLFWEHFGDRAARLGRWKIVAEKDEAWQLYDLENDRAETRDLSAQNAARVAQLNALWRDWANAQGVYSWDKLRDQILAPAAKTAP